MVGQSYDNVYIKLYTSIRKSHGAYVWGTNPNNSLQVGYDNDGFYWISWIIDFNADIETTEDVLLPGVYKLDANDIEIDSEALFVYSN